MTTYKHRVAEFWSWFQANSNRFLLTIDEGNCDFLTQETTEAVHKLGLGAWVYGPPPKGAQGHSLTVSGEGVIHKQFLTEYWLSQAPKIEGWSFHASRQAGQLNGYINIKDLKIEFQAMWIRVHVDNEREKVDISVWHHHFPELDDKDRFTITFIVLDEVLGEYGTDNWVGEINFAAQAEKESMPVAELKEYVDELEKETGWKKYAPTEVYNNYQIPELEKDFPRSDTFVGTTSNFNLVRDFLEQDGEMTSPVTGSGADFIYITCSNDFLPKDEEVIFRGEIEDSLHNALEVEASGQVFGGASGEVNFYIDLAIYDGEKSIEIIKSILNARNFPSDTTLRYFEKGRDVIPLNE